MPWCLVTTPILPRGKRKSRNSQARLLLEKATTPTMASDSGVPLQNLRRIYDCDLGATDARLALASTVSLIVVFRPSA